MRATYMDWILVVTLWFNVSAVKISLSLEGNQAEDENSSDSGQTVNSLCGEDQLANASVEEVLEGVGPPSSIALLQEDQTPLSTDANFSWADFRWRLMETLLGDLFVRAEFTVPRSADAHNVSSLFASVQTTENATRVILAPQWMIAVSYIALVVVLTCMWHQCRVEGRWVKFFSRALGVTNFALLVGGLLVDQSLLVMTGASFSLHASQAALLWSAGVVWFIYVDLDTVCENDWKTLRMWLVVAGTFGISKVADTYVGVWFPACTELRWCLCAIITLILELTVTKHFRFESSHLGDVAVGFLIIVGIVFCLPHLKLGMSVVLFAMIVAPMWLVQRWFLSALTGPIAAMAALDGVFTLFFLLPEAWNETRFWNNWDIWLVQPSVILMLFLSFSLFISHHVCCLLILRLSSATTLGLLHISAHLFVAFLSVVFAGSFPTFSGVSVAVGTFVAAWLFLTTRAGTSRDAMPNKAFCLAPVLIKSQSQQ
uniref:Transmembrane protein n=1 Tax=Noctiluca scintillans TaxID=2966 RepID=A0A7S1FFV3_NOCSC|mmetsp:Transcript_61081/g.162204  ORF Transcript_61081/g.162204 Transcript_61081/m.162204 type:complete len:485 (+) Transcript_61081:60-1514(+)